MDAIQRTLGGALIALSRKHMPNYSFAAFVHHDEDVDVYFFKGRLLERKTSLSAGSETIEQFRLLQKSTKQRNGVFSRAPYKAARITTRAREQASTLLLDFDDPGAFTATSEGKRAAFDKVIGGVYPDTAKNLFSGTLEKDLEPADLTRKFIADFKEWSVFSWNEKQYDDSEARWNQGQSYDDLIVRYCGPEKNYQGLVLSSEPSHCPEQETIIDECIDGNNALVKTRFKNAQHDFITHDYQYEFQRASPEAPWRLKELWYYSTPNDLEPML